MSFEIIDFNNWKRKEWFLHYYENVPCTYSVTTSLDITCLIEKSRQKGIKLYPILLYLLTKTVNEYEEFRTSINENGDIGVFDRMNPSYTIFNKQTELFMSIWTDYNDDFELYYNAYLNDINTFANAEKMFPKGPEPINCFPVSNIPWISFDGFNLNLDNGSKFLLPIFTIGKFRDDGKKIIMPLSVQVHHGVCDGFHIAKFINEFQNKINYF